MQIEQINTPKGRFYEVDGKRLPSVTTILDVINKPFINDWRVDVEREFVTNAACELYDQTKTTKPLSPINYRLCLRNRLPQLREAERAAKRAADLGTAIHAFVEWELRNELGGLPGVRPYLPEGADTAIDAWHKWRDEVKFKPLKTEFAVYSYAFGPHMGYAGTVDWLGEVNSVVTLGDIKTGKRVWPEAFLQNVAYRHAYRSLNLDQAFHLGLIQAGLILRLPKLRGDAEFEAVPVPDDDRLLDAFKAALMIWKWQNES